ncbi:hypothetical protein DR64_8101 [Paraburkholderia xenovorans LB400]|uniref:DUF2889 domain-containing protein n=1 Tax=Paraburkholderia xenovorans (strain LB400) TaxID=266265 RepID=Q13I41_PARXL|nr:DUF2889 domain-containing protein [Paraburkholderia xenovorans]ABE36248.1 Conserved hypothetical protein [Paraburkholderia xenovorans LB400]AIP34371.1 hypothetical protein DR64_8101 [Paraburkholderia xenovorans LB400]
MTANGLPAPAERELLHERKVHLSGFHRKDGLWDLEARMTDERAYSSVSAEKGQIPPGQPIHDICVRVTVNDDCIIKSVSASMNAVPYHTCPGALASLANLEGATLGRGWRKRVEDDIGAVKGCTHIRDLLIQVATVAYQTIPIWHAQQHGDVFQSLDGRPPSHLGTCLTWAFDGPVVAQLYPEFARSSNDTSGRECPPR